MQKRHMHNSQLLTLEWKGLINERGGNLVDARTGCKPESSEWESRKLPNGLTVIMWWEQEISRSRKRLNMDWGSQGKTQDCS